MDYNELIIRYLDGTASVEDKKELLNWLESSEQNKQEFFDVRDLWLCAHIEKISEEEIDRALDYYKDKIYETLHEKNTSSSYFFLKLISIAAVFTLLIGFSFWKLGEYTSVEKEIIFMNKLITAENSKGRYVLPDGTVVWLNHNTTLEYPESFSNDQRKVKLNGEAYFEVSPDKRKPFFVGAGEIDVEVTGTSFVVQNYDSRKTTDAVLLTGKVNVSNEQETEWITLQPNQLYSYSKSTNEVKLENVNGLNYIGWINDRLIFDNTPLSDIVVQLTGWYGIDIKCGTNSQNIRMSFMIRDESLEEILKAMKLIAPLSYKWENGILKVNSVQ